VVRDEGDGEAGYLGGVGGGVGLRAGELVVMPCGTSPSRISDRDRAAREGRGGSSLVGSKADRGIFGEFLLGAHPRLPRGLPVAERSLGASPPRLPVRPSRGAEWSLGASPPRSPVRPSRGAERFLGVSQRRSPVRWARGEGLGAACRQEGDAAGDTRDSVGSVLDGVPYLGRWPCSVGWHTRLASIVRLFGKLYCNNELGASGAGTSIHNL
jgi:hypothetical protein